MKIFYNGTVTSIREDTILYVSISDNSISYNNNNEFQAYKMDWIQMKKKVPRNLFIYIE